MAVNIGKLNKRVTFQKLVPGEDDLGQDKNSYEDVFTVWATVKPSKASEFNFIGKVKPEVTHRIYVRYRPGITADMRIIYNRRTLYLSAPPVNVDEKYELLEIQAEERFENGGYQL